MLFCLTCTFAQKGRIGFGAGAIVSSAISETACFGAVAQCQYSISNTFRIEPYIAYYFSSSEHIYYDESPKSPKLSGGLNLHVFFLKGEKILPYFIAGASYSNNTDKVKVYDEYYYNGKLITLPECNKSENKFGGNAGIGVAFRINYNLDVVVEAGYNTAAKDFAKVGFVYNF